MPIMNKIVMIKEASAATWATSENVLDRDTFGETLKQQPIPRILTKIGFVGGAAVFGTALNVKIGSEQVASILTPNTTGFDNEDDCHELNVPIAPNETVSATVSAASGTNPFVVYLEFDDHPAAKMAMLAAAEAQGKRRGYGVYRRY